jgi:hypothetical protein
MYSALVASLVAGFARTSRPIFPPRFSKRTAIVNRQKECLLICGLLLSGWMCGCNKGGDEEIHKYSIPKTKAVYQANHVDPKTASETQIARKEKVAPVRASKEKTHRMIGALVPDGRSLISFKMTGPNTELKDKVEPCFQLIKSIKFDNGQPVWELPKGWVQLPDNAPENNGSFPRLATIIAGPEMGAPKFSAMRLVMIENAVLENVNRWRRQLGLPAITDSSKLYTDPKSEDVEQEVRKIKVNGRDVILVDLIGYPPAR